MAVVEALRMNPDRYAVIYNIKYDNNDNVSNSSSTTTAPISSSSSYLLLLQNPIKITITINTMKDF